MVIDGGEAVERGHLRPGIQALQSLLEVVLVHAIGTRNQHVAARPAAGGVVDHDIAPLADQAVDALVDFGIARRLIIGAARVERCNRSARLPGAMNRFGDFLGLGRQVRILLFARHSTGGCDGDDDFIGLHGSVSFPEFFCFLSGQFVRASDCYGRSLAASLARSRSSSRASRSFWICSVERAPISSLTPSMTFRQSSGVSEGLPSSFHQFSIAGPRWARLCSIPPRPPERCRFMKGPSKAQRSPGPFAIAVSMSATVATPISTRWKASRQSAACRRLATWPAISLRRWIGRLPIAL